MPRFSLFCLLILLYACSPTSNEGTSTAKAVADSIQGGSLGIASEDSATESGVILFLGNSLTAGYGLDLSQSFPSLIQQRIDSLGYDFNVVNAGLSGETTSGGKNRIDWLLRRQEVEILVIELGANDGLRGIPVVETRNNLEEIISIARGKYPDIQVILCGMEVPPNMGPEYQEEFRLIFKELAETHETALVPFLLYGVAGEPDLNLADGIHPTSEGHQILAENVWAILEGMILPN